MTTNELPEDPGVAPSHARHGKLGYLEIPVADVEQSALFYRTLFGWSVDVRDSATASYEDGTGELIGHMVANRVPSRQPGFLPYVYVDDVAATIAQATAMGSEVVEGPRPEGDLTVANLLDPGGNVIGIWHG